MRSSKAVRKIVVNAVLMLAVSAFSKAYADARWYDTMTLGGYLQGSYVNNLTSPATKTNAGRIFDVESNSFNLNAAHIQIAKPIADDGYGFTLKLHSGRDARIIKSVGTAGATDFDVQEAYMSWVPSELKKLTVTGGKFVTLEGIEVIESPMNPNFSEGLLFGYAEPFTHTGVKANYAFSDMINATFGVVNGWDTEADANDGKTIIWQIAATPTKMVSTSLQGSYGPEAQASNDSKRTSVDYIVTMTPTSKLSLSGQANWGQDSNATVLAPGTAGPSVVRWAGLGFWATYATTDKQSEAIRFEVLDDANGANRLGAGVNSNVKGITLTHKIQLAKNMFTRLEFRHDWASAGIYNGHAPGTLVSNQNTLSADYVVTF